jgi:hypothetical protein
LLGGLVVRSRSLAVNAGPLMRHKGVIQAGHVMKNRVWNADFRGENFCLSVYDLEAPTGASKLARAIMRNTVSRLAITFVMSTVAAAPLHAQSSAAAITAPSAQIAPSAVQPMPMMPQNQLSSPLADIHSAPEAQKPRAAIATSPDTPSRPRGTSRPEDK